MQVPKVARTTIHVPAPDLNALYQTCMDLKNAMELVIGRYDAPEFRPRMTVQDQPPKIERDGDFWLCIGATNILSVSLAGQWRVVGPVT